MRESKIHCNPLHELTMRKIFAITTLIFGTGMIFATAAFRVPTLAFLRSDHATVTAFVIAVAFFLPFVITYTQLGLNSAEGEDPSPETEARHAALKRECPIWPLAWYGGIGFVGAVWIAVAAFSVPLHPFFAFSGVISILSGIWFLSAYPVACRLFKP